MSKQDEDFNLDENSERDYIKEMIEYQKNQFNPGYYVGTGKIPPDVEASGNPMPLAVWMFIQAAAILILYIIIIKILYFNTNPNTVISYNGSPLLDFILFTVVFSVSTFICIWIGVIYLKKAKLYKLRKKQFEESDLEELEGEEQIAQKTCPICEKQHDIDYPKCPYCQYRYISMWGK